jgi:hypothetical protein
LNGNEYLECSANENKNIINNKNGFHDQNGTDYEFELKVEQIMDITKCMDIALIKEKLIQSDNNVDLTLSALYSINNNYDHASLIYSSSSLNLVNHSESSNIKNNKNSKSSITKSDKKREKKQRQMERQKQKVVEENAKLSDNNNDINIKSDNKSHNSIDEPTYSVSINVNTKSI